MLPLYWRNSGCAGSNTSSTFVPGKTGFCGSNDGLASIAGSKPYPVCVPMPAMKSNPLCMPAAFASPSVGNFFA